MQLHTRKVHRKCKRVYADGPNAGYAQRLLRLPLRFVLRFWHTRINAQVILFAVSGSLPQPPLKPHHRSVANHDRTARGPVKLQYRTPPFRSCCRSDRKKVRSLCSALA